MKEILSFSDFQEKTRKTDSFYLLFHKSGSNSSDCAFNAIRNTHSKFENIKVFSIDVSTIKDIHTLFRVNSVPTLLEINKDKIQNMVKGCQNEDYFSLFFEKSFFQNKNEQQNCNSENCKNTMIKITQNQLKCFGFVFPK